MPAPAPGAPPAGRSNRFLYQGEVGTHKWYDGTQHPWEFKRVWHLEPSLTDPETVYAGVEDAAIFKSVDGGKSWAELPSLRAAKGHLWQPGAAAWLSHHPARSEKSAAHLHRDLRRGDFRTDDGGNTWQPINKGLKSALRTPDPDAEVGHCVHRIAFIRRGRTHCSCKSIGM
jgi:hypothetical protein